MEAPTIQAEGAQTNSVQVKSKTYNDLNNNLEDCMQPNRADRSQAQWGQNLIRFEDLLKK